MARPDWRDYYIGIAQAVAARSECDRSQVGCVIVQGRRIVATGYNGAPPGQPMDCGTCPRTLCKPSHGAGSYSDCPTIHAEVNALLRASWADLEGAVVYVTRRPCKDCWKILLAAPLEAVRWPELTN